VTLINAHGYYWRIDFGLRLPGTSQMRKIIPIYFFPGNLAGVPIPQLNLADRISQYAQVLNSGLDDISYFKKPSLGIGVVK